MHDLLRSLAPLGIAPRPVALDDEWETVTFLDGVTGDRPLSDDVRSDAALVSTARLLRRFHDAAPGMCHNDIGPWNVVFDGPEAVGLIDWDEARPGPALSDVASAVWHFAPLYDDAECVRIGFPGPPDRRLRVEVLAAAYGIAVDGALWSAVQSRQQWYLDRVLAARAAPGLPGAAPWAKVDPALVRRDIAFTGHFRSNG